MPKNQSEQSTARKPRTMKAIVAFAVDPQTGCMSATSLDGFPTDITDAKAAIEEAKQFQKDNSDKLVTIQLMRPIATVRAAMQSEIKFTVE